MKNKNIWIFQTGEPLHSDSGNPRPMRAINLANTLIDKGYKVIIWSSNFYHQTKKHRYKNFRRIVYSKNLEIRLVPSPGYKKNISFSRLYDHFILALNLYKQLEREKIVPDFAFVGYPPIECAYIMSRWLKLRKIPYLIDIKDQWPSIFIERLPNLISPIAKILFFPYFLIAKKTIIRAKGISTISNSFLNWSLSFANRKKNINDFVAPLTSPKLIFSYKDLEIAKIWWIKKGIRLDNKFRIVFIGSFSKAFDFEPIFNSAKEILLKKINCEFVLCGDGELNSYLKIRSKNYKNIKIIEWLDQLKIYKLVELSSAFIAPYNNSRDFKDSIPNKVIDSFKYGLPLITCLKGEVQLLIKNNNVGIIYNQKNLTEKIESLINNKKLHQKLSNNAKILYNSKFDYRKNYEYLVLHIERLLKK